MRQMHSQNSISSRHQRVRTRLQRVQYDLERLEMNEDTNLAQNLIKTLDQIDSDVAELKNLATYESPVWKARVEMLVSENNETRTALQQITRTSNFDKVRRDIMNDLESGTYLSLSLSLSFSHILRQKKHVTIHILYI